MGNQSSRKPNTNKIIEEKKTKNLKFASCKMQGWRINMVKNKIKYLGRRNSK